MAKDLTPYQQRIVRSYYRNLDQIRADRLQEIVGEIFLAGSEKKRERLWTRVAELLDRGEAPPPEVRGILERRDLEALARLAGRE